MILNSEMTRIKSVPVKESTPMSWVLQWEVNLIKRNKKENVQTL